MSRRTFFRHMERSAAFTHDVALAEDEAERRMTTVVFGAAAGGDVKAAIFWLERRRPADYRLQTQATLDGHLAMEQEYPAEVLALARRYAGLTAQETDAEIKRLAWAVAPADSAGQERIALDPPGGVEPLLPPSTDEPPETATDSAEAVHQPEPHAQAGVGPRQPAEPLPPLEYTPGPEPIRCIHCRGTHEAACPNAIEGAYRIDPFALGDPR